VDTSARIQGRAERGPTARKQWREFRAFTETMMRQHARDMPGHWRVWHELCELGRRRRWWTVRDVRLLLRPWELKGVPLPELRARDRYGNWW
jgi:hypothetical protein